jgi:hypothetical protein
LFSLRHISRAAAVSSCFVGVPLLGDLVIVDDKLKSSVEGSGGGLH